MPFKIFMFGRSSTSNSKVGGQPYEKSIALEPPVKGSYPVAGNGPSLEHIQRGRARRDSIVESTAPSPNITRTCEDRPRTAPHNGYSGGGYTTSLDAMPDVKDGTFSLGGSPNFLRRSSVRSFNSRHELFLPEAQLPQLPRPVFSPIELDSPRIKPAQPRTRTSSQIVDDGAGKPVKKAVSLSRSLASPPPEQSLPLVPATRHKRSESQASHRSHVDLVDAHSSLHRSIKTSRQRAKAIGLRNFGEDVADRNIKGAGATHIDLCCSEFSYLKHMYVPTDGDAKEPHLVRVDSALGHVLGHDGGSRDDTHRPQAHNSKPLSLRSFAGSRPAHTYTQRDSVGSISSTRSDSCHVGVGIASFERQRAINLSAENQSHFHHNLQAGIPPARTLSLISQQTSTYGNRAIPVDSTISQIHTAPAAENLNRGRSRTVKAKSTNSRGPPVSFPSHLLHTVPGPKSSSSNTVEESNMATVSQSYVPAEGSSLKKPPTSYSAFPTGENHSSDLEHPIASLKISESQGKDMLVEGATEKPSLEGIVDLKDSVDTDVITTTLPGEYPRSTISRDSVMARRPFLSPLHYTTPHDILDQPSFPHANWPLSASVALPSAKSADSFIPK